MPIPSAAALETSDPARVAQCTFPTPTLGPGFLQSPRRTSISRPATTAPRTARCKFEPAHLPPAVWPKFLAAHPHSQWELGQSPIAHRAISSLVESLAPHRISAVRCRQAASCRENFDLLPAT